MPKIGTLRRDMISAFHAVRIMENLPFFLIFIILLTSTVKTGQAFSFGAPAGTCWTMYPKHSDIPAQSGPSPYLLRVTPDVYAPGDLITVIIRDPLGKDFKGLQIGAHRQTGNVEEIVGQFTGFPANKFKVFTCFGGYHNMVTHWNREPVDSVSFTWKAPEDNVGNITFRATILMSYEVFWRDVLAELYAQDGDLSAIKPSLFPVIPLASLTADVDWDQCGDTKGCFLYPRYCTGRDCIAAVSYQHRPDTDDVQVEMMSGLSGVNYISLALSKDKLMGHDETFTCVSRDGFQGIQQGHNPEYHNARLLTRFLSGMEIKHNDGRLQCRFVIPMTTGVYQVDQTATEAELNGTDILYNLNERWYLHLAWGNAKPGSDVITIHKDMPASTDEEVDIKRNSIERGSAYHNIVRAHAAVMMVAWIFLSGIVTVISRHFKQWMPDRKCCGTKIWFQVHRGLAILVTVLTAVGLTLIFAHYGSEIREESKPHSILGLIVTAAVGLQLICGLLRPGPDHKLRPLFNWGHRLLGYATHITSAITMFLAYDIDYVNKEMRTFGFIVLGVWIGVQVLCYLAFEILRCRRQSSQRPQNKSIDVRGMAMEKSEEKESSVCGPPTLHLAIYVIILFTLCVVSLLSFLFF